MGMGDKPKRFIPPTTRITCDVTKREFASGLMRKCSEPNVNKYYGENISLYICKKCKYSQSYPYFGGIACEYDKIKEITKRE